MVGKTYFNAINKAVVKVLSVGIQAIGCGGGGGRGSESGVDGISDGVEETEPVEGAGRGWLYVMVVWKNCRMGWL